MAIVFLSPCLSMASYTEPWDANSHNWNYWDGSYPEDAMLYVAGGGAGGPTDGYVKAPLDLLQPEHSPDVLWPAYTAQGGRDPEQNLDLNNYPIIKVKIRALATADLAEGFVCFFIGKWVDDFNYVFWYYNSPLPVNPNNWHISGNIDVSQDKWTEIVRVGMGGVTPQSIYSNPQQYGFVIVGHAYQPSGELRFDDFANTPKPATWQMKQRDRHNTGRADFSVPPDRMNGTFFDVLLWQKKSPVDYYNGNFQQHFHVLF